MDEPEPLSPRRNRMSDALVPVLVLAGVVGAWFVLNRWILPRFGVST
jgi:hypothetical protein